VLSLTDPPHSDRCPPKSASEQSDGYRRERADLISVTPDKVDRSPGKIDDGSSGEDPWGAAIFFGGIAGLVWFVWRTVKGDKRGLGVQPHSDQKEDRSDP
jgi:hypothetical protein